MDILRVYLISEDLMFTDVRIHKFSLIIYRSQYLRNKNETLIAGSTCLESLGLKPANKVDCLCSKINKNHFLRLLGLWVNACIFLLSCIIIYMNFEYVESCFIMGKCLHICVRLCNYIHEL